MKNYYVYYSYEEWGRGYIGHRGCVCQSEEDVNYFGTYKDKTFNPTQKIIIACFSNREEAIKAEMSLHKFFDVVINPNFVNRARQTSTRFTCDGANWSGENNPNWGKFGELNSFHGKRHSEKTKELLRKRALGRTRSKESREKQASTMRGKPGANRGRFWITDGNKNKIVPPGTPIPEGWQKGRTA